VDAYTDICLRRVSETLGLDPAAVQATPPTVEIDVDIDTELAPPWAAERRESMVVPRYDVMPTEAKTLPPGPRRRRSHLALVICGAIAASAAAFAIGHNPHVHLPLVVSR
jgi:hypothetical protein